MADLPARGRLQLAGLPRRLDGAAAEDVAGKILAIFFPIMAFVAMGFDHVVANMFFLPAAIFAGVTDSRGGTRSTTGSSPSSATSSARRCSSPAPTTTSTGATTRPNRATSRRAQVRAVRRPRAGLVGMPDDPVAPLVADYARYRADEAIRLADLETDDTDGVTPEEALRELASLNGRIAELQARLYAEEKRAVPVVLQGIDAAGKDSSVKHVFRGTNPQGVRVYSFKEPTPDEAAHDFLWRYHQDAPALGMIHVFNRSHYEDVLVVRVKGLIEEERWRSRYDSINDFERMLVRERTVIVKFFLHISKAAQLDRFRERLEREDKHYKFSANDVRERRNWDAYQEAYEDAINLRRRSGRRGTSSRPTTSGTGTSWWPGPSRTHWRRRTRSGRRPTTTSRPTPSTRRRAPPPGGRRAPRRPAPR